MKMAILSDLRTCCSYPFQEMQLILIPVRGWVDPRARLRLDRCKL